MIDKLKALIRDFKLGNFVKSALRNDVIAIGENGETGIDKEVFVWFIDRIPTDMKDEFVDRIYNLTVDAQMNSEIERQNRIKYIEKVKDMFVSPKKSNESSPVGCSSSEGV